jgi:biopolymer transport protein ExbD
MGSRRFRRRTLLKEDMNLQITSMADIFTILLVFLLKSFSTGISNITPGNELMLPVAKAQDEVSEMIKVEISPTSILVDDHPAAVLHDFKLDSRDVESNGTSRSLNTVLINQKSQRAPASEGASAGANPNGDRPLMILADEKTPYTLLRSVMVSAQNSGFSAFKLVVVEDQ